tara:strand:+ start:904 stop:1587 length:684 start_codon:yes stop_codon:yes gene_type:complete
METYRILNLYSCLGGNRLNYDKVVNRANYKIQVTAVENDPELAKLYQIRFPNDIVVIGDAKEFLLKNFRNYDYIFASPPCPTHSKIRHQRACYFDNETYPVVYPDMSLYQIIILLDKYFKGKWTVENVAPYYTPLIPPKKRGRHLYWTNFNLPNVLSNRKTPKIGKVGTSEIQSLCEFHKYDFKQYKGTQRIDKIARNLVDFKAGETILETALNIYVSDNSKQTCLF